MDAAAAANSGVGRRSGATGPDGPGDDDAEQVEANHRRGEDRLRHHVAARRDDRSNMVGMLRSGTPLLNLGTLITLILGTAAWYWLALGGGHLALIGVSPMG